MTFEMEQRKRNQLQSQQQCPKLSRFVSLKRVGFTSACFLVGYQAKPEVDFDHQNTAEDGIIQTPDYMSYYVAPFISCRTVPP